jgi:hypothetical protein
MPEGAMDGAAVRVSIVVAGRMAGLASDMLGRAMTRAAAAVTPAVSGVRIMMAIVRSLSGSGADVDVCGRGSGRTEF